MKHDSNEDASAVASAMQNALMQRFGEDFAVDPEIAGLSDLARMASRKVTRRYAARPVSDEMLRLLCGCALSAPSKSDLQQGDIPVSYTHLTLPTNREV